MLDTYIKENGIIGLSVNSLSDSLKKKKEQLDNEIVDRTNRPSALWKFMKIVIFLGTTAIGLILVSFIFNMSFGRWFGNGGLAGILLLIFSMWLFRNIRKKPKEVKVPLSDIVKERRLTKEMLSIVSKEKGELSRLGKIQHNSKNNITGNIKRTYMGEIYISFPDNTSDKHELVILNHEDMYSATKEFGLSDITQCKLYQSDYDEKHYDVDTSSLESASGIANRARAEKAASRAVKSNQGILNDVSHDKKLIAERDAKVKIQENIKEVTKKKKDETVFLLLAFEDGSTFHINHIIDDTLGKLQKLIEQ